jgi:hypothetical protein
MVSNPAIKWSRPLSSTHGLIVLATVAAGIAPCDPDGSVTLDDVLAIIDAFAGRLACPQTCE